MAASSGCGGGRVQHLPLVPRRLPPDGLPPLTRRDIAYCRTVAHADVRKFVLPPGRSCRPRVRAFLLPVFTARRGNEIVPMDTGAAATSELGLPPGLGPSGPGNEAGMGSAKAAAAFRGRTPVRLKM